MSTFTVQNQNQTNITHLKNTHMLTGRYSAAKVTLGYKTSDGNNKNHIVAKKSQTLACNPPIDFKDMSANREPVDKFTVFFNGAELLPTFCEFLLSTLPSASIEWKLLILGKNKGWKY